MASSKNKITEKEEEKLREARHGKVKTRNVQISIRFSQKIKKKLTKLASSKDLSLNAFIASILYRHFFSSL